MTGRDWLDYCGRFIDQVTDLQGFVTEQLLSTGAGSPQTLDSMVEATSEYSRDLFTAASENPEKLTSFQGEFVLRQLQLAHNTVLEAIGMPVAPMAKPSPDDQRFADPAWDNNLIFSYLKQAYLIAAESCTRLIDSLEGIDDARRKRMAYYTRQMTNAMAPTNFAMTNPEVIRRTIETDGQNLLDGLHLLIEDRKRSADIVNICSSRPDGFEIGRDIAATPGEVVAQNSLMQLIQYTPTTERVHKTPVLIVPSWVNKYYVMDLAPRKSLIRWMVAQGHTVFVISWINPDASYCNATFDDYMESGPFAAIDEIERITNESKVSLVGYCLGGIMAACVAAWYEAKGEKRLTSLTYLASSLDYTDSSAMGVFVDKRTVDAVSRHAERKGFIDGRTLAAGFSFLRENDLYWNYYITNYLKGERPAAFDIMHWNSDNTNVPATLHRFVLNDLHLRNGFIEPGAIELCGKPIDLRAITVPTYVLSAENDHIAYWQSCYAATQLQCNAPVRFVLAGAGHVAGIINPPGSNKYHYSVGNNNPADAEQWRRSAVRHDGSWWTDWHRWQESLAGPLRPARAIETARIIEPAPGSYVRRRLDSPLSEAC